MATAAYPGMPQAVAPQIVDIVAELPRKRASATVARDFIVLDSLGSRDQSGIDRPRVRQRRERLGQRDARPNARDPTESGRTDVHRADQLPAGRAQQRRMVKPLEHPAAPDHHEPQRGTFGIPARCGDGAGCRLDRMGQERLGSRVSWITAAGPGFS